MQKAEETKKTTTGANSGVGERGKSTVDPSDNDCEEKTQELIKEAVKKAKNECIIITVIFVLALTACIVGLIVATGMEIVRSGKDYKELKKQINSLEARNKVASTEKPQDDEAPKDDETKSVESSKNDKVSTYEKYFSFVFPSDGTVYKIKKDLLDVYWDFDCTIKVKNPRFCSTNCENAGYDMDGFWVYALRLDDGRICYSSQEIIKTNFEKCE